MNAPTLQKKATYRATMEAWLATGVRVADFPTYKSLNDAVGAAHGVGPGRCQALAGKAAWAWTHGEDGLWRRATADEAAAKAAARRGKPDAKPALLTDAEVQFLQNQIQFYDGLGDKEKIYMKDVAERAKMALDLNETRKQVVAKEERYAMLLTAIKALNAEHLDTIEKQVAALAAAEAKAKAEAEEAKAKAEELAAEA